MWLLILAAAVLLLIVLAGIYMPVSRRKSIAEATLVCPECGCTNLEKRIDVLPTGEAYSSIICAECGTYVHAQTLPGMTHIL